jgi:hypothetical protein
LYLLAFGIGADAFWEAAGRLHAIELLDMYENEVVKVSDQVLGTYLFFLAAFHTGGIDLTRILEHYFPAQRHRIIDALNSVVRAFGSESMFERVRESVDQVWQAWASSGDEGRLRDLMHTFWFARPTETLLYADDQIRALEEVPRGELVLAYENATGGNGPSLVGLLGAFRGGTEAEIRIALGLLLDYAAKRSTELPQVLNTLVKGFGFHPHSVLEGYQREAIVVEVLQQRAQSTGDPLFAEMLSVVTGAFLQTKFEWVESGSGRSISIMRFELQESPALREVRNGTFDAVFWMYRAGRHDAALRALAQYTSRQRWLTSKEIASSDAEKMLAFLPEVTPAELRECLLVHDYLDQLDRLQVPYDKELRTRFSCPASRLADLLLLDRRQMRQMGWDELHEWHRDRIRDHFRGLSDQAWSGALDDCRAVRDLLHSDQAQFQIGNGIATALTALAEEDSPRFLRVLQHYLASGDPLRLPDWQLIRSLIAVVEPEEALAFLRALGFPARDRWISTLFASVPAASITPALADEVLAHLRVCGAGDTPHDLEFLKAYLGVAPSIIVQAVRIITDSAENDTDAAHPLTSMFNRHGSLLAELSTLFAGEAPLLKRAYLAASDQDPHMDYDGSAFALMSELNPEFPGRYLEQILDTSDPNGRWARHHSTNDSERFAQLWKRNDYETLMRGLIERAFEREREDLLVESALRVLLSLPEPYEDRDPDGTAAGEDLAARQDTLLSALILERAKDRPFLQWLFDGLTTLPEDRKRALIAAYLATDPDPEEFQRIPLESSFWMARGSLVPVYQRRLDFLESLLPLFNRAELLRHRAHVIDNIDAYRKRIRNEKRVDFFDE